MIAAYTGNGAYCFSNSLHMTVLASGADPLTVPETWFVECLTVMPFGRGFWPAGPHFAISGPRWSLERQALPLAIEALGWRCETTCAGSTDEALVRLRDALERGPAMLGPLDFGYLSYHRGAAGMAGFDHYIVGLELGDDGLLVHDPAGRPYATLPVPDLLDAWRADAIDWKTGPFTIRSHFQAIGTPTRPEMIARVLPDVRANVQHEPERPGYLAGHRALRALAALLRDGPEERLERNLVVFALPTVTRRAVDAARFLSEAGLTAAASAMADEAVLWGRTCTAAVRRDWTGAATQLDRLADAELALAAALVDVPARR